MTPCNLHTCSPFGATVRSRVSCICVVRHIRHLQRTFHTLLLCSAFLKRSTPEIIIPRIMINVCGALAVYFPQQVCFWTIPRNTWIVVVRIAIVGVVYRLQLYGIRIPHSDMPHDPCVA